MGEPAERLTVDPATLQCPDFELPEWETDRNEAIEDDANLDHQAAANMLKTLWKLENKRQRRRWVEQQAGDRAAALAREERLREEEEREAEERDQRLAEAAEDERKKYKDKFTPVPANPLTADFVVQTIAESARAVLRKGSLLQLYFCTLQGIQAAMSQPTRELDESSAFKLDEDGRLIATPKASAHALKGLVKDDDLSWEMFCLATPVFLQQAALAGWPEDRIRMFAQFWDELQSHRWRWNVDPLRSRALIKYQAVYRRQWHFTISAPGQNYTLVPIDETLLERVYQELRSESEAAKSEEREAQFAKFMQAAQSSSLPSRESSLSTASLAR